MRINELLTEETLDELSLAQVGKGVGNVIRKTSSAVHGAKGAWHGAKDAWNQGKQSGHYNAARNAVSGGNPGTTNSEINGGQKSNQSNSTKSIEPFSNSANRTKSATEIADDIKTIYSDQSNPIGAPVVKQEIIALAKAAGMKGQTIESVGYSRFLGMTL